MDRFQAMHLFTRVVEMNSFSRAAASFNLPPGSATNIIKSLEAHLQVRLLQRTTRRLNLTPEGADYYERCIRLLAELEEVESALTRSGKSLRGKLRIDMPPSLGHLVLMPRLSDFRAQFPEVELMIGLGDRRVDLVAEGVDCALRVGALEDSTLVARQLGRLTVATAASPKYLAAHGYPRTLSELNVHEAVHYFSGRTGRVHDFKFVESGVEKEVKMRSTTAINDADAYVACGIQGVGLIQAPLFMMAPHMTSGALVEVLADKRPRPLPLAAVFPHNRLLAPKVRAFVEWAATVFASCPLLNFDTRRTIQQDEDAPFGGSEDRALSVEGVDPFI
ncbi:LysR family transcriptional regulator [Caballeronia grimmiae]|uniref:LysR family transcriptional regulator n=2 Tax=Caballeronia grimmiae TaxID=1071679 RepID=A0A069NE35_9BURK|nr:LysR family transcriptional regulator [Caballeronia grimmiae]KDR26600.1 LysR family transcriptional regulator [Caballeronia grimmiae]